MPSLCAPRGLPPGFGTSQIPSCLTQAGSIVLAGGRCGRLVLGNIDKSVSITYYTIHKRELARSLQQPERPRAQQKKKRKEKAAEDALCLMACLPGQDDATPELRDQLLMLTQRMGDRSNVVMTRIDDEDLKKIDALVEIEIFRSRSEATAFFVKEGVGARTDLFREVMPTVEKIRELKGQAKESLRRQTAG